MWNRDSFHNCAMLLSNVSNAFQNAFVSASRMEQLQGNRDLLKYSRDGIELLQSIALTVRSEQDYKLVPKSELTVGALCQPAHLSFEKFAESYHPPYKAEGGFSKMLLRTALDKIAHYDPRKTTFRASRDIHEIIIGGTHKNEDWIAVLSIPAFCQAVMKLPDHPVNQRD